MKPFKYLSVTYRISIIILLALYAEHVSACNWFKFYSKPSEHNINHGLIKTSNQGTQTHILNQKNVQNHATETVNISNQEPQCNCKYDVASKTNSLDTTIHVQEGKKLTNQSLVKHQVEKISSVSNQDHKCNCKQSALTNANTWKSMREVIDSMTKTNNRNAAPREKASILIREALDKLSKTNNQITTHINSTQESSNQGSATKVKPSNLIFEALRKMAKSNNPATPNIETKQESKYNCKQNDATKENALQHETKFNCKHESDLKSLISGIKDAIQRVENTFYISGQVAKLSCDHYSDIKKYALLSFNNVLNSIH